MSRREIRGSSSLDSTDSTTKANVEQHHYFKRRFTSSPLKSNNSDNHHIYLIRSNHNSARNISLQSGRYIMESMTVTKTMILLICLHSFARMFDSSMSLPILAGMMTRKLHTDVQEVTNKVPAISFRQPRVIQVNLSLGEVHSLVDDDDEDETYETSSSREDDDEEEEDSYEDSSSSRKIKVSKRAKRAKKNLKNSYQYKKWQKDPKPKGCEALRDWQETSYATCNKMHEVDFHTQATYLARGALNSVFQMVDINGDTHIVKILRYRRDYTERNFDRVRRDSLVMERATRSKYVIDIYSFCGFSQIIEFGKDGGLDYWMLQDGYDDLSQEQKLQIATQISQSLTDIHNLDGDGIPSMTHGDIAAKQYILIDGIFKLNDFNRGRMIHWNSERKEPCPYTISSNDGKFRSPEEYKYLPQTAAIDVYTLGSVFVEMVTGKEAWYGYEIEVAQQAISDGTLPPFGQHVNKPSDPITQVLLKVIEMCYVYDPKERPKASDITDFLKGEAKRLGVQWDKPFEGKRRNTLTTV